MTYNQPRGPALQGQPGVYDPSDPRPAQAAPHQPNAAHQPGLDLDRQRTHDSSTTPHATFEADANGYIQVRQQPINDAVASGINATESINNFSPEIISQLTSHITASVLQQLKVQNAAPPTPAGTQPAAAPTPASPTMAGSPPLDRSMVKTPPSPYRASEEAAQTTVSPTQPQFHHTSYAPESPPRQRRPMSPFSSTSQADDSESIEERATRPRGPKRISTGGDATIIEKTWGALFTEEGQTTLRLRQFLRGIAVHIIEDYEPKHSLVITPAKLQKYYEETKLSFELYPWQTIFDDRSSSISRLYRDFEAQHHLVQDKLNKRPSIPGLTPHGFEAWATALLLAHPDQEFERLSKTALYMPISNPDDRKERFPKEISRRLFPKDSDAEMVSKLQEAIHTHCGVVFQSGKDSISADTEPQPPQTSYRADEPAPSSPVRTHYLPSRRQDSVLSPTTSRISPPPNVLGVDRDRNPRSNASDAAVSEDDNDTPTPQPIERERKPYVAQPGQGKSYADFDKANAEVLPEVKIGRTMSMNHGPGHDNPRSRPIPIAIHQRPPPPPIDGGEIHHTRTNNTYARDQQARLARQRSPSLSANGNSYGHRSEGDVAYGASYHSASSDVAEDARRHREFELQRERNATDRYDPARMAAYDPRERDRDQRPRMQSTAGLDGRPQYANEEDYFRATGGSYPTNRDSYPQYPPSSYR